MLRPPNIPLRALLAMVGERFVNLRCLKLKNMKNVCDEDLISLGNLPNLACLSFIRCNYFFAREITDMGVNFLGSLSALKELHLNNCVKIKYVGLRHLGPLVYLTNPSLCYCFKISDEGARHSGSMLALRELDLNYFQKVTDVGVQHLAAMTSLIKLSLCG